ncbi:metallophosphoesterase family protein [Pseudobutyrivibrio ruminis]|uniref:metallophosphoesterase family protein n=1 Tax=Pseudobutyrivibrio ruminis TaxID=46206 RepID=UPI0003F5FA6A
MKYYISDLHLFHNAAIRFDNRPFDNISTMHEYIHTNWNNKITNGDTVYILGDVSLRGQKDNLIAYVSTLKGQKVLVKGNHDDVSDYRYQQLFSEICDYKEVHDSFDGKNYDLVLSHYPIFSWKNMGRGWIHLYGHTHNSIENEMYLKALSDMKIKCGHLHDTHPVAINVGCMKPWMGYEPRTLREILEGIK